MVGQRLAVEISGLSASIICEGINISCQLACIYYFAVQPYTLSVT